MCLLRADRAAAAAAAAGDAGESARLVGGDTNRKLLALETRAGEGIAVKVCKIQIEIMAPFSPHCPFKFKC